MSELFDSAANFKSTFTHKQLIPIAYKWVLGPGKCGCAFKELNSLTCNSEYPDVLGIKSNGTVLIEAKVSLSDFYSDKKKTFRKIPKLGMGDYRFYMCPSGLIKPEQLPENWGLIYVNIEGKARCVVNPYCKSLTGNIWNNPHEKNWKAEQGLMYSALRRLHIRGHIESIYEDQGPIFASTL